MRLPKLRFRWIAIFIAFISLIALAPSPTHERFVSFILDASQALADGHPAEAAAFFESALLFDPSNLSLYLHAAQAYLDAGEPEKALRHLESAQRYTSDPASLEALRGEALLATGDLEGATESWASAGEIALLPEETLRNLAYTYFDLGLASEAYTAFSELVTVLPQDLDALVHLGVLAVSRSTSEAEGFVQLASQHAQAGHPLITGLTGAIEEGLQEESRAYQLALVAKALMQHGEWELAAYTLQESLDIDPTYVDARAYLGLVLFQIGEDGMPELLAAIEANPDAMLPYILLGMHYLEIGETALALQALQTAADLNATNPAVLAQLGAAFDASGEIDQAMLAYRSAAELVPEDPRFWLLLAQFALSKEIEIQTIAIPAARNAIALEPDSAGGLDALGYAYYLLGNHPLAERLLTESVRIDPSLALTQYHLGLLRLAQDQVDRARAALELAVLLDPGGPVAELALLTLDFIEP